MIENNKNIESFVKSYLNENSKKNKFIPGETLIPPSGKLIGNEEIKYMVQASLDGWLTTGRFNDEFQKKLSNFLNVKHLITVNSGSSANLVAFSSLTSHLHKDRAIKPGDEVIVSPYSMIISATCAFATGAVPVFADIDPRTLGLDTKKQ